MYSGHVGWALPKRNRAQKKSGKSPISGRRRQWNILECVKRIEIIVLLNK